MERYVQCITRSNEASHSTELPGVPKFYGVSMLPYPSGNLHIGHIRNYVINDILHRHMKTKGYNSLMPMGWDAFGLPAENAASEHNVSPSDWVKDNINKMKQQLRAVHLLVDWRREIVTSNASYYKWNQLLFLRLFDGGLVSRKLSTISWDPTDKTVLSNEQIVNGKGWRSGSYVQKRRMQEYFVRITDYAEELTNGLSRLSWPRKVKTMQENWIAIKSGVDLCFLSNLWVTSRTYAFHLSDSGIITRGVLMIHPFHYLANNQLRSNFYVRNFIRLYEAVVVEENDPPHWRHKSIDTGLKVFVSASSPLLKVMIGCSNAPESVSTTDFNRKDSFVTLRVCHLLNRRILDTDFTSVSSVRSILSFQTLNLTLRRLHIGSLSCSYGLKDWGISRQRHWGTPIPTTRCAICDITPVGSVILPILLTKSKPTNTELTVERHEVVNCPVCDCRTRKEQDTLDTFFDSSWYFLRYTSWDNDSRPTDSRTSYWLPIDTYIGGVEHAVLHLLYTRFVTKVLGVIGVLSQREVIERLVTQGTVTSEAFYHKTTNGRVIWLPVSDVQEQLAKTNQDNGPIFSAGRCKMSKSKRNGFNSCDLIQKYGADVVRLFTISLTPLDRDLEWTTKGINGIVKLLNRMLVVSYRSTTGKSEGCTSLAFQKFYAVTKKVTEDYNGMNYHNILPSLVTMLGLLTFQVPNKQCRGTQKRMLSRFLQLSYPIIPHSSFVFWRKANCHVRFGIISLSKPTIRTVKLLVTPTSRLVVQIDGKIRREVPLRLVETPKTKEPRRLSEGIIVLVFITQKHLGCIEKIVTLSDRIVNVVLVN